MSSVVKIVMPIGVPSATSVVHIYDKAPTLTVIEPVLSVIPPPKSAFMLSTPVLLGAKITLGTPAKMPLSKSFTSAKITPLSSLKDQLTFSGPV